MVAKKQIKKTVVKSTNKKQVVKVKKTPCKQTKCVKPIKVSIETVQKPIEKKSFWTKVKELFGF